MHTGAYRGSRLAPLLQQAQGASLPCGSCASREVSWPPPASTSRRWPLRLPRAGC